MKKVSSIALLILFILVIKYVHKFCVYKASEQNNDPRSYRF